MRLHAKDVVATLLTGLAVLVFVASHEGWDVPLVGDSHRWAAAAILLLGMATCALGSPDRSGASKVLAALGVAALAFGIIALVTGSLTALSLLTADMVVLWAASTARHVLHHHPPRAPVAT